MENIVHALEHLTGFVIVILALTLLWGATVLMSLVCRWIEKPTAPAKPATATTAKSGSISDEAIVAAAAAASIQMDYDDENVVVISAAVASILDARHRIVSIRPVSSSWGQQGRREIHASHRIR